MAHQDHSDHRSIASEAQQDPTSITIEFLRSRLLAERAVSKSVRAQLNELTDKVADLEEQLKIVSLQRKKAEQATAHVLEILEENGFTDVSDDNDLNSDHGSETYSQTNSGKSISWKGRRKEPSSSDNTKESRNRRHRGFETGYFSSSRYHRQGRSCRQIRRNESRASEDYKRDGNPVDFRENGVCAEIVTPTSGEASRTVVDSGDDESLKKLSHSSNGLKKVNSMDTEMERALENRANVIGSFENMEETQKEWEKKFREKKSSALDLCEVGNHSDVTDESNVEKARDRLQGSTQVPTRSVANETELRESFETSSRGSRDNSVTSPDKCCKSCGSKSVEQDTSPWVDNGKHISETESPKSESSFPQSYKGINEHSSPVTLPNLKGVSVSSKVDYPLVPTAREKSDTCDTVLTALEQAKLSLQQKVNSLHIRKPEYLSESSCPSTPGSYMMNTNTLPLVPSFGTTLPASSIGAMVEFPVSCAGLFRVPTDFSPDTSSRNNSLLASTSEKALVSHMPSPPLSKDDRLLTTPYIGGPKLWAGFRADGESVVAPQLVPFNLERQVSTYTPVTPTPRLYQDSVMLSKEMYSTPYYTRPVGFPPISGSDDGLLRRV